MPMDFAIPVRLHTRRIASSPGPLDDDEAGMRHFAIDLVIIHANMPETCFA